MSLEKGYDMDPYGVASMRYLEKCWTKKFRKSSRFVYGFLCSVFYSVCVFLDCWHFHLQCVTRYLLHVFRIFIVFFQLVFNDETWMNVESIKYLEKDTSECQNIGLNDT